MGLRFRKSFNWGGIRINLSKSGIGYSYGIKGFRKTKKASGGHRTTLSIPGTGISYVKDSKKHFSKAKKNSSFSQASQVENSYTILESSISEIQSSFAQSVQKKYIINKYWFVPFIVFISSFVNGIFFSSLNSKLSVLFWILFALSFIALIIFLILSKKIKLDYSLISSDNILPTFNSLKVAFNNLKNCSLSLQIYETKNSNNNMGATSQSVHFRQKSKFIKSNVELFEIYSKNSSILFLPDLLLVFTNKKYHTLSYEKLIVNYLDLEHTMQTVPTDSFVINQKYLYETKNNTADRRYKYNPLLNNCAFGGITFQSKSGLDLGFIFSNRKSTKDFYSSLKSYISLFSSIEK